MKKIAIFVAAALVAGICLSACGSTKGPAKPVKSAVVESAVSAPDNTPNTK